MLERGLRDAGFETRLFERDSAGLDRSLLRRSRAALTLAYDPAAGGITDVLDQWRPAVVHFHNVWPLLTPAAMRAAHRSGAAVVLTLHNCRFACPGGTCPIDAHPAENGLLDNACLAGSSLRCGLIVNPRDARGESAAYGLALEVQRRGRMLSRWVDSFIAPSTYIAAMLDLARVPGERVRVIPNGIPASAATSGDAARYALFLGRVSELKGVRTLIKAASLAPEVPIAIAGEGPLVDEVRASPIEYLGQLDAEGVNEALDRAAFTVLPSECHENAPYAALESLAAGKPVIASRVGGVPEIVRDAENGLIVPPRSPAELAAAMRTLWTDPELIRSLGARATRIAHDEFSLDRQIQRTTELYRELNEAR